MDEKIRIMDAIRSLGRNFNPDVRQATFELFTPLQKGAPKDGVVVHRDISYGDHERHKLDVFASGQPSGAPVVIYFHGGGYVGGQRSPVPGLIYDNVPTFFARRGMVGVNATYRLAPEHSWPSGGKDVGSVVDWTWKNISRFGGDPSRIVLIGQSAGGTHVATYAFISSIHGPTGPRVAGIALLSSVCGPLHPDYFAEGPAEAHRIAYFGSDEKSWPERNPINHIRPGHPPVLVGVAEFEPWPLQWSSPALVEKLAKCDREMPWFVFNRGHNHVSPAMQINSAIDELGPVLLDFVHQVCRRPK
jgi:acetyl esterase/lipase